MTYDPERHHRRSIRLKGYDYAQAGAYFVTICAQNHDCLFGEIVEGEMRLNEAGRMVQTVWDELSIHYPGVDTDAFVVMPNHVHGIIVLDPHVVGADPRVRPGGARESGQTRPGQPGQPRGRPGQPRGVAPTTADVGDPRARPDDARESGQPQPGRPGQPRGVAPTMGLPDVVHRFKTLTTKLYTDGVKQAGWPSFPGRLWQRNYYEHIVRDEESLNRIRQYIVDNPARWPADPENPAAKPGPTRRSAPTGGGYA